MKTAFKVYVVIMAISFVVVTLNGWWEYPGEYESSNNEQPITQPANEQPVARPKPNIPVVSTKVQKTNEASFEETRAWIISKFNKYSTPRRDEYYSYNPKDSTSKVSLTISECFISSYMVKKELSSTPSFSEDYYSNFELKHLEYVSYSVTFKSISITFDDLYSGSGHSFWGHKGERKYATNELKFYFNFTGGENNIEDRMKNAFLRLAKLAKNNPRCNSKGEAF